MSYQPSPYMGRILSPIRERNGYHDSDFYALVWVDGDVEWREVATTRFPVACPGDDAWRQTPADILDAAAKIMADRCRQTMVNALNAKLHAHGMGSKVRIVKPTTRGKNKTAAGTTGTVAWQCERRSQYGTWSYGVTYGVDLDGETAEWNGKTRPRRVFVSADNVEAVADRPDYTLDDVAPRYVEPTGPAMLAAHYGRAPEAA